MTERVRGGREVGRREIGDKQGTHNKIERGLRL